MQVALTSQEVIECLDFRDEDKDREAKQFIVLAIQNLENGLCGINLNIIHTLLDALVCSIVVYFYDLCCILTSP